MLRCFRPGWNNSVQLPPTPLWIRAPRLDVTWLRAQCFRARQHLVKWFNVWGFNCSDESSWNIVCLVLLEEAVLSLQLIMQLFHTYDPWSFCCLLTCLVSVPKCSKSCNSGIRTRQVICADGDSKFYSPETCKAIQIQKPATLGSCNTQPCYLPQREWYCCTPAFV